jgi:hypothetical protein
MKKKLLFVTYFDEHPDSGLSYVIELAKVMKEDLTIFLLRKKMLSRKFDDLMTAVTFAEAGEQETARQSIADAPKRADEKTDKKIDSLLGKCEESGIKVDIYSSKADAVSTIENYFKHRNGIDIVLLGPNVTDYCNFSGRTLKRLSDTVARPIVTIAKQTSTVSV